jgi:tetratricopeptide (TPR) repeat protein
VLETSDRYAEALDLFERATTLARRRGDRGWESILRTSSLFQLFQLGRWDEALAVAGEEEPLVTNETARAGLLAVALVHCERGDPGPARTILTAAGMLRDNDNAQSRVGYAAVEARVLRAEGHPADALASAERGLATVGELGLTDTNIKAALVEAIEAALILSNFDKVEDLLSVPESLDPGQLTPFLQAHTARLRARLDAARGQQERIDELLLSATRLFHELGLVFHHAVTQLEHAEWLAGQGRADAAQPLLAEARDTFEKLRATPWLERAAQTTAIRRPAEAAISQQPKHPAALKSGRSECGKCQSASLTPACN